MSLSESYEYQPRVTSTYRRTIYEELEKISQHIDFRHPIFRGRHKRNRSLGSVQALIVELALTDEQFLEKLRRFMINGGRDWKPTIHYFDRY